MLKAFFSALTITSTIAISSSALASVRYEPTCNRVKSLTVNNVPILGDPVSTGGIYLEGSIDGTDNEGKNITSRGASCNQLISQSGNTISPTGKPTPQYSMNFTKIGRNEIAFDVRILPIPEDLEKMNLAFDFDKRQTDSFRFDGSRLLRHGDGCIGLSGNLSGASYRDIRRICNINDAGLVGVAITANAPRWAEVSGTFGTVRVRINRSSHFNEVRFHNHPGADNLDLAFGQMKKGESAFVQGVIKITPSSNSSNTPNNQRITFEAESQLSHQIGRRDQNGWSVNVRDTPNRYLSYGPYTTSIPAGRRTAQFRLMLDNVSADNNRILTLDVYNADTGRILAIKELRRRDFRRPFSYQDFNLQFNAPTGQRLEFRTYWHGGSYVNQDRVTIF